MATNVTDLETTIAALKEKSDKKVQSAANAAKCATKDVLSQADVGDYTIKLRHDAILAELQIDVPLVQCEAIRMPFITSCRDGNVEGHALIGTHLDNGNWQFRREDVEEWFYNLPAEKRLGRDTQHNGDSSTKVTRAIAATSKSNPGKGQDTSLLAIRAKLDALDKEESRLNGLIAQYEQSIRDVRAKLAELPKEREALKAQLADPSVKEKAQRELEEMMRKMQALQALLS